jgi:hypothetical protein
VRVSFVKLRATDPRKNLSMFVAAFRLIVSRALTTAPLLTFWIFVEDDVSMGEFSLASAMRESYMAMVAGICA